MNIIVARDEREIDAAAERMSGAAVVGCDTETSGLNAKYARLFSVQFSDGDLGVLVPVSEGIGLGRLAAVLSSPGVVKVFHNARFDIEFLSRSGIAVANVFDTMIAEKVLTKGANQSASLAETLYRYIAVDLEKSRRSKFNRSWDGIWTPELVDYALSDVMHLPALMREQASWMERLGLTAEFELQMQKMHAALGG